MRNAMLWVSNSFELLVLMTTSSCFFMSLLVSSVMMLSVNGCDRMLALVDVDEMRWFCGTRGRLFEEVAIVFSSVKLLAELHTVEEPRQKYHSTIWR